MMSLTRAQAECLDFIARYQRENEGVSPSFDEIRQELGLASKSGVHRIVAHLIERGRLLKPYNRVRAFEIVPEDPFDGIPTPALWKELQRRGEIRRAA